MVQTDKSLFMDMDARHNVAVCVELKKECREYYVIIITQQIFTNNASRPFLPNVPSPITMSLDLHQISLGQ